MALLASVDHHTGRRCRLLRPRPVDAMKPTLPDPMVATTADWRALAPAFTLEQVREVFKGAEVRVGRNGWLHVNRTFHVRPGR
jgi:hypothetical protein